eukprot:TRINITY_DN82387_c0_g1_i1.p1 TRINITY_DN82387_c0_g1~~TRINITY_DN82387_c0_g1_i1.p1  ORF type:complete len:703 (+),score=73.02 TRINITY_DN82387_c0_g1_i1:277-2385(+)
MTEALESIVRSHSKASDAQWAEFSKTTGRVEDGAFAKLSSLTRPLCEAAVGVTDDIVAVWSRSFEDHAPVLPDLLGTTSELLAGRWRPVFVAFPSPLFADLQHCRPGLREDRKHYFCSLLLCMTAALLSTGVVATFVRNAIRRWLDARWVYLEIPPRELARESAREITPRITPRLNPRMAQTEASDGVIKHVVGRPLVLFVIVYVRIGILLFMAVMCVTHGTMNEVGVGWELWTTFVGMHFCSTVIEVMLSSAKTGQLGVVDYVTKAAFSALPFISEKADAAKDLAIFAVALANGQVACALLNLAVLLISQYYFLNQIEVRSELREAYMPILTTSHTHDYGKQAFCRANSIRASLRNQMQVMILKQIAPARLIIGLGEDLPQGLIAAYLAVQSHGSWFCLLALSMNIGRLVVASTVVAKPVRRLYLPVLRRRRNHAVKCENRDLALELTGQLWDVDGEDLGTLSPDDGDYFLLEALASMVEQDIPDWLHVRSITSSDCAALLFLAALGNDRGPHLRRLEFIKEKYLGRTTMLHMAAMLTDQDQAVEFLVACNADVNSRNPESRTPVHIAAKHGRHNFICKLKQCGAGVGAVTASGITPMHMAAEFGQVECIETLKCLGADVNAGRYDGQTPFHTAAHLGQTASIEALKNVGANIDAKDNNGNTPLHISIIQRQPACVAKLQALGADATVKNNKGQTYLDATW